VTVGAVDGGTAFQYLRTDANGARDLSGSTEDLVVGQLVEVTVVDQSSTSGRYGVRINGQLHSADSTTALQPGSTVLAVVTRLGSRLELRAVSIPEDPALAQALAALAARYRVELSASAQRQIAAAASATPSALDTLRSGLYLKKLGEDVSQAALGALVAAQQMPVASASGREARGAIALLDSANGTDGLSKGLGQLLERATAPQDNARTDMGTGYGFADAGGGGRQGRQEQPNEQARRDLAQQLLNLSDGGALQYRYATLPLLVGGKLVELDMALFQQRAQTPAIDSPRRLVMSLTTSRLGAVRIVAQSLHSNLSVSLLSNSERGVALLSAALPTIRQQLAALGWQLDGVRCEYAAEVSSAGRDIVDHVLTSSSLDRAV